MFTDPDAVSNQSMSQADESVLLQDQSLLMNELESVEMLLGG